MEGPSCQRLSTLVLVETPGTFIAGGLPWSWEPRAAGPTHWAYVRGSRLPGSLCPGPGRNRDMAEWGWRPCRRTPRVAAGTGREGEKVPGVRACATVRVSNDGNSDAALQVLWAGVCTSRIYMERLQSRPMAGPAWPVSSPFSSCVALCGCDWGFRSPHRPPPCGRPSSSSVGSWWVFSETRL